MKNHQATEKLNVFLGIVIPILGILLQFLASRQDSWSLIFLTGIVFSFLYLPLYSLIHETEHKLFHNNYNTNEIFGIWLATFFPGSFSFMRSCHLGHHSRNRTDAEMFDYYYPQDNLFWKRIKFYSLFFGGFWCLLPISTLIFLIYPRLLHNKIIQSDIAATAMVQGVSPKFIFRIRMEALFVVLFHLLLIFILDLSPWVYFFIYYLYGLNWSAQQYIPHANSPRHVLNGAHNLKTNPFYEKLLLHFNWHLAHHQHPTIPWYMLPHYHDPQRDRPEYLNSFIKFWKGPKLCEETPPKQLPDAKWEI